MAFCHLHLHTEYSMLDGANKIKVLAKKLKELGMKSVAITDHGNMFGALDFYVAMKEVGIKPIIGIETYIHNSKILADKTTPERYHLCLFAKNEVGYKNLMYLSSQAFIEGFYYNARINKDLLRAHSQGIVASAACLSGEVNYHLNTQRVRRPEFVQSKGYEVAKDIALGYRDIFGEDFYLEIMRHGISDQEFIDPLILRLSRETGIKVIATNDTHYTKRDDALAQEIAMCIATGKKYDDPDRLKHTVHEFFVKSEEEMRALFLDIPEVIDNTQEIADKCNLNLDLKNMEIIDSTTGEKILKFSPATPPNFKLTKEYAKKDGADAALGVDLESMTDAIYFAYKCREGLESRLANIPEEKHTIYRERLEREIEIITKMNFPGYMLIVWDFINYAKRQNIPVGPGRGSAAGSLVAYALKITNIDPIKYNLLFERFLNPERVSMPDIDTDFCQRRREEVIKYMKETYGKYNVAQVITFGKMLAKGVLRDVGRVFDMPLPEVDALCKLIPGGDPKITLTEHMGKDGNMKPGAWELEPKIREFVESSPLAQKVWDNALLLEGLNRNAGVHAAAIVVDANEELWNKVPLYTNPKMGGDVVTQYSMNWLEPVDLIKFDFLGLKTLTMIQDALNLIKKRYNKDIDFSAMSMDDEAVFSLIQTGNTIGMFQIESEGMQGLCRRLKPSNFEDLIAILALYRPGPMESGMIDDFIERKHGRAVIEYPFAELEPILKPTYGVIVYQEQVMQIVQRIGGFSLGGADLVRRAMGKKKLDEMLRLKGEFADGAVAQGFNRTKAEDLWELVVKFAGYGFNKSHSAAYAMISYQTAYLKTHYEHEFMAAMMTSENKVESVARYIFDANKVGIKVTPPHINVSDYEFSVADDPSSDSKDGKKIVFGLKSIKGVGDAVIEDILEIRKNGAFSSLADFISRADFSKHSKRSLEPMIKSGALDGLGYSRRAMLENIDTICELGRSNTEAKKNMKNSLFGSEKEFFVVRFDFKDSAEYHKDKLLEYEYENMGIYASGHPLDSRREEIEQVKGVVRILDLNNYAEGSVVMLVGLVMDITRRIGKSGKPYGIMNLVDLSGRLEMMLFEAQLNELENKKGEAVALKCKVEHRAGRNEGDEVIVQARIMDIFSLEEAKEQKGGFRAKVRKDGDATRGDALRGDSRGGWNRDGGRGDSRADSRGGWNRDGGRGDSSRGVSRGGWNRGDSRADARGGWNHNEVERVLEPSDFGASSCLPMTLLLDSALASSILPTIKEAAARHVGNHELRLCLRNKTSEYVFITGLKVNPTIKTELPGWI